MSLFRRIPPFLRNKYFLATAFFVTWLLFFDHNDFFTQMERRRELKEIRKSKEYFAKQIEADKKFSNDLQFNAATIEKYAREKYLMKRENEDIFIVPEKPDVKNN